MNDGLQSDPTAVPPRKRVPARACSCFVALALLLVALPVSAYEQAYAGTSPGTIEVKTVPATLALQAEGTGRYFDTNGSLFRRLFSYIGSREVKMTVPIEADVIDANRMRFFVGSQDVGRPLPSADGVTVVPVPEKQVVAIGLRGSYSAERFDEGRKALETWLAAHPEWKATGPPRAVYWNGPFVPFFMKRSEVQVTVTSRTSPK